MLSQSRGRTSNILACLVVFGDLLVLNGLYSILYAVWSQFGVGSVFSGGFWEMMCFNTICYIPCVYKYGVELHFRKSRNRHIVSRVLRNNLKFAA